MKTSFAFLCLIGAGLFSQASLAGAPGDLTESRPQVFLRSPQFSPDSKFLFLVHGVGHEGVRCVIEMTEDFQTWSFLADVILPGDDIPVLVTDPDTTFRSRRFYRAVLALDRAQEELNRNRATWEGLGRADYVFSFQWFCFCPPEQVAPVWVSVLNGQIESVILKEKNEEVEERFREGYMTIEALFNVIQDAIDREAHQIEVEYDPEEGYPRRAFIDYELFLADEEIVFEAAVPKPPPVLITDRLPKELQLDPFALMGVALNGLTLTADVEYSGGCQNHHFTLFMSPRSFLESAPVQANLFLRHDANGDACRELVRETVSFDLRPVAALHQHFYGGSAPIILNVFGHFSETPGDPLQVTYLPE